MKKFTYFMAAAAIVAASANATNVATVKSELKAQKSELSIRKAATVSTMQKAPAKVTDYSSYTWVEVGQGTYGPTVVPETYGTKVAPATVTVLEAEGHAGLYKLVGVWPELIEDGQLIVDATDPTFVTIPVQSTGITDNVDGITYIASIAAIYMENGATKEQVIANAPDAVLKLVDKVIDIPAKNLLLNWPEAPADSKYGTDPEDWYYGTGKNEGYVALPGGEYVDPWVEVKNAKFNDNILYPIFFQGNPENTEVADVVLYENKSTSQYKLMNPWKTLFTKLNFTSESPEMIIDATDPTDIMIGETSTGINGGTDGIYYVFSESYYCAVTGDVMGDAQKITLKEENGKMVMTFPIKSMDLLASGTDQIYYASAYASTLTWDTEESAINTVAVSNDAKTEYFNLQGVRVSNPENGLYIMVKDGKSSKVVVK